MIRRLLGLAPAAAPVAAVAGEDGSAALASRREVIRSLYGFVLKREPSEHELDHWASECRDLASVPSVIARFFESDEYRNQSGVVPGHPPGHFYSPIPDPRQIDRAAVDRARRGTTAIPGVDLRLAQQEALWAEFTAMPVRLVAQQVEARRYFHENPVYGPGDALVLSCMLGKLRPRRVIEVGSGFSSACMLDAADDVGFAARFTFIEPYPDGLYWHMREADREACEVIASPVQAVDPGLFETLEAGDLCFIDSTHVMKSGSDVNFEFFEVLPRLKPGVVVHFHDVFWPFEYPADWLIHRRYAWNELYGLRSLLMNNERLSILFFNDAFAALRPEAVAAAPEPARSLFTSNPGGGLWLEVR